MGEFLVNQRYTSAGEPELGVGIVTEVSKGKVRRRVAISLALR